MLKHLLFCVCPYYNSWALADKKFVFVMGPGPSTSFQNKSFKNLTGL